MNTEKQILTIVRHGESVRNFFKPRTFFKNDEERLRVGNIPDHLNPLTTIGNNQSIKTGEFLGERHPDGFYISIHSGYLRTIETHSGIETGMISKNSQISHVKTEENYAIRERDAGFGYNMTEQEALEAFPYLQDYWKLKGPFIARPPGGESMCDLVPRLTIFLDKIFERFHDKKVLLVSHGIAMRVMFLILEEWSLLDADQKIKETDTSNCGIFEFERWRNSDGKIVSERILSNHTAY